MYRTSSRVSDLIHGALAGRQDDWNLLVERYTPLVLSVVRGYRLNGPDSEDVFQTLWLRLVEHLADIREPQALPGWIITTVRNECLRTLKLRQRTVPFDPLTPAGEHEMVVPLLVHDQVPFDVSVVDDITAATRREVLLRAFDDLSERHRELLLLLITDPPVSYTEISRSLGIPVGSIGPTRARALERIRQHPAVAAWMSAGQDGGASQG